MRLLVKLRPQTSLNAANPRVSLRPLFESPIYTRARGLTNASPAWLIADAPDHSETPWDAAHNQLAATLGVAPGAILFAEPDLPQSWPAEPAADSDPVHPQHNDQRPAGPGFAWHTGDAFSQLASAHAVVNFKEDDPIDPKALWLNSQHLRTMPVEELVPLVTAETLERITDDVPPAWFGERGADAYVEHLLRRAPLVPEVIRS